MKEISMFCFMAFCFLNSYSQKFNYGACFINPNFFKLEGKINISDSTVEILANNNGVKEENKYSVLKKVNGVTYITDGVMTHSLVINSQTGKKKGFEYDNLIIMTFDKKQGGIDNIIYYCKLEVN